MTELPKRHNMLFVLFSVLVLGLLYASSLYNYLLFHTFAEFFSIAIAMTVFLITWNSAKYLTNNYFILVGISTFFIGILDMFHTLSYKGMAIFYDYDFHANQVWVATRLLESLTLLLGFLMIRYKKPLNPIRIFIVYLILTTGILLSIFVFHIFPVCFIEGKGQTPFKIISEYVICTILFLAFLLLLRFKGTFSPTVYHALASIILLTIGSELCFTIYTNNYAPINLLGHYLKIFAFYQVYRILIRLGVKEPYETIFRELVASRNRLDEQNKKLNELANLDGLTGLYNHRHLFDLLKEECSRNERYKEPLSLIILDIDHFKLINDKHGHMVGDDVLSEVASLIQTHTRKADHPGRYGGEEFMIILPHTTLPAARQCAETLRQNMEQHNFHSGIRLTVSGGVGEYARGSAVEFAAEVDRLLYLAKEQGRNRIVAAVDPLMEKEDTSTL